MNRKYDGRPKWLSVIWNKSKYFFFDKQVIEVKKKDVERMNKKDVLKNSNVCSSCNVKITGSVNKYYCKYCKRVYCINHRLPEQHKNGCKPKNPYNKYARRKKTSHNSTANS